MKHIALTLTVATLAATQAPASALPETVTTDLPGGPVFRPAETPDPYRQTRCRPDHMGGWICEEY